MTSSTPSFAHLRELKEIFPMLTVCTCVSDAEESRNGPRYCAQDKITKVMYEMRCLRVDLPQNTKDSEAVLSNQQRRLDSLLNASQRPDLPFGVSLPIDVYMQEVVSTKDLFLVSVSPFTGLSLGDVIRSGWRLLEERDFDDILRCVEEYGLESSRLPPHCNLNLNAVMRELTARHGAVELNHKSRWVIGDWDLLVSEEPPKPDEVIADIEWLLFSAFSKLNVSSDIDGALLRREKVEARIMETIDRIRSGLSGCALPPRTLRRRSQGADSNSPSRARTVKPELSKAVVMHQAKLREEQQLLLDYRRRSQLRTVRRTAAGDDDNDDTFVADGRDTRQRLACAWSSVLPSEAIATLAEPHAAGDVDWRVALLTTIADTTELRVHRALRDRAAREQSRRMQRDGLRVTLLRAALLGGQRRRSSGAGLVPGQSHGSGTPAPTPRNGKGSGRGARGGGDSAQQNAALSPATPAADDEARRGVTIQVSYSPLPAMGRALFSPVDEHRRPHTTRRDVSVVPYHGGTTRSLSPACVGTPRDRQARYIVSPNRLSGDGRVVTRNLRRHIYAHPHTSARGSTPHTITGGPAEKTVSTNAQHYSGEGVRRSRSVGGASGVISLRGRMKPLSDSASYIARRRKMAGCYDANM